MKLEVGSWKSEVGRRKFEVGRRKTDEGRRCREQDEGEGMKNKALGRHINTNI